MKQFMTCFTRSAIAAGACFVRIPSKYPPMRQADIVLTSLGVLAVAFGLLIDNSRLWFVRACLILLGVWAIGTVVWHRIYG